MSSDEMSFFFSSFHVIYIRARNGPRFYGPARPNVAQLKWWPARPVLILVQPGPSPAREFAWPARPGPGPMEIFFTAIFLCQNSKITCVINNVLESTLFQCYREFFSQIAEIEIKSIWDESSCLLSQTNKQKTFEDF